MSVQSPQEIAEDAAERFRAMRKEKKLSRRKVSEESGVPYATIRHFEETGSISFLSLVKIASVLGEDERIQSLFKSRSEEEE